MSSPAGHSPQETGASQADAIAARREFVTRFQRRDGTALEELYDRISSRAFGLAFRVLGDGQMAEDVVQVAFVWVWGNPHRLDPERGSVDSLVMTVVHRRAIDAVRSRRRRSDIGAESVRERAAIETSDIADEAQRSADASSVAQLIYQLPAEQRQAIEMAYFQGYTQSEIAESVGIPLGTVKGRLRLAMGTLRQLFGLNGAGGIGKFDGTDGSSGPGAKGGSR